ncbi:hypothetical protein OF83DRAFT_1073164, partial [Amylostereum chailletii]
FHCEPFEHLWQPTPDIPPQAVYRELYVSAAFREEHEKLQLSSPKPGCTLAHCIIGLMLGSDEMHLTLWPVYNLYSNESKCLRARPSPNLCEHVAFLLKVGIHNIR